jgi:DeoR/GlpR family transcriptional regulator of sugar metabolism
VSAVGHRDAQSAEAVPKLTRSYVGADTARAIERVLADRLVFSVKGVELNGDLTDPGPFEAEVKRLMVSRARTVVLLAIRHKFGEPGLHVIIPASEVDIAYLADPPAAGARAFEAAGVEVKLV